MYCCLQCFDHKFLQLRIARHQSVHPCDFCGGTTDRAVRVGTLASTFKPLVGLYEQNEHGSPLVNLLQDDWHIFSDRLHRAARVLLLAEILDELAVSQRLNLLPETLCIKVSDRWTIPDDSEGALAEDRWLDDGLRSLSRVVPAGRTVFRARLGFEGRQEDACDHVRPYCGEAIGAPPPEKVRRPGRLNRVYEPVLYCATTEATAVAELRPSRGLWLSVCELTLASDIHVADFADFPELNPFDSPRLPETIAGRKVCERYGKEFARPLERDDDLQNYVRCHHVRDRIEGAGYSGVVYPSSLHRTGRNFALFDLNAATIGKSWLARIIDVAYFYRLVDARRDFNGDGRIRALDEAESLRELQTDQTRALLKTEQSLKRMVLRADIVQEND